MSIREEGDIIGDGTVAVASVIGRISTELGIQKQDACIFARFTRKMHGKTLGSQERMRHPKDGCLIAITGSPQVGRLKIRERLKIRGLGTPEQIWIAEAMLQLCYHKGASMACALQRIAGIQIALGSGEHCWQ